MAHQLTPHKIKQLKHAADQRKIKHYLALVKDKAKPIAKDKG